MRLFVVTVLAILHLLLVPFVRAETSREGDLKRRLDDLAIRAAQDSAISPPMRAGVARLVPGAPAGAVGATGSTCAAESPDGKDLQGRIAWNRFVEACTRALARAARMEAARSVGQAAVSLELLAAEMEKAEADAATGAKERAGQETFLGYEWGIGFGASYSFDDIVDDAVIVDGIVRVSKDNTTQPRVVLEFHKLFFPIEDVLSGANVESAHGPFFAVAAKSDELISGFGLGWMIGWKDSDTPGDSSAFTIGVGVMLDADVESLAEGFSENQPPPAGETEVRFKEKSRASAVLIVTRTF